MSFEVFHPECDLCDPNLTYFNLNMIYILTWSHDIFDPEHNIIKKYWPWTYTLDLFELFDPEHDI